MKKRKKYNMLDKRGSPRLKNVKYNEHLQYRWYSAKNFVCIAIFVSYISSMNWILLSSSYFTKRRF